MIPRTLVFGIGNPSRGDDAVGPVILERLAVSLAAEIARGDVELLTDFQLQIEHTLDLRHRDRVIFVDASVSAPAPLTFTRAFARRDASITTHAMSPEALLETFRASFGEPPEAWIMAVRGEQFELGEPPGTEARERVDLAVAELERRLRGS